MYRNKSHFRRCTGSYFDVALRTVRHAEEEILIFPIDPRGFARGLPTAPRVRRRQRLFPLGGPASTRADLLGSVFSFALFFWWSLLRRFLRPARLPPLLLLLLAYGLGHSGFHLFHRVKVVPMPIVLRIVVAGAEVVALVEMVVGTLIRAVAVALLLFLLLRLRMCLLPMTLSPVGCTCSGAGDDAALVLALAQRHQPARFHGSTRRWPLRASLSWRSAKSTRGVLRPCETTKTALPGSRAPARARHALCMSSGRRRRGCARLPCSDLRSYGSQFVSIHGRRIDDNHRDMTRRVRAPGWRSQAPTIRDRCT